MRVTACSPSDPQDIEYYKANGYKGAAHNVAADLKKFPKGTLMKVPGYMISQPGKFWEVDSAGGSVIRRSARQGVIQIDVKFELHSTAIKWGSKMMDVEVITSDLYESWQKECIAWEKKKTLYLQALDERDLLLAAYHQRYRHWQETCAMIQRANDRANNE